MRRTRIASLVGLAASLALAASAVAETCHGEKVTISFRDPGVGKTITGTAGPDVIQGGPQRETILGLGGDDVICAGDGDDTLVGGPGRDELDGQDGNDKFSSTPKDGSLLAEDIITGGVGDSDTADYSTSPVGVTISLARGLVRADGAARNGGILGVESVLGTPHDDRIVGNAKPNILFGYGGNDIIDGREGEDVLAGNDGVDTVSYATADAGIRLNVDDGQVFTGPGNGDEDLISTFEIYYGSKHDDRLVGSDRSERLVGGAGDDTLKGLGDGDTLEGGPGDDTIYPGQGDDLVNGGANRPVTSIGAPGDLASYADDTAKRDTGSSFDFEAYLVPDPHLGTPPIASGVGEDHLVGIESIRGPKTAMSYLEGDDGPNVLIGGSRIDDLVGNGGDDLLFGLNSNDVIDGGDGNDYLDGGEPHGEHESDKLDGGNGDDTCLGALPDYRSGCETTEAGR